MVMHTHSDNYGECYYYNGGKNILINLIDPVKDIARYPSRRS